MREYNLEGIFGLYEFAGSEGIDKIFSPEKLSSGSSAASIGLSSSNLNGGNSRSTLESTVASLEQAVTDSQAKCTALISDLEGSDSSVNLAAINQLTQKLESMQSLLTRLRTQI